MICVFIVVTCICSIAGLMAVDGGSHSVRDALLKHVSAAMNETPGQYFSITLSSNVLRSLAATLAVSKLPVEMDQEVGFGGADPDQGMGMLDPDAFPEAATGLVFVSVIDQNPAAAIRAHPTWSRWTSQFCCTS